MIQTKSERQEVSRRDMAQHILTAHVIQILGDMVLWKIPFIDIIRLLHLRMPEACLNSQAFTLNNGFRFRLKLMLNHKNRGKVSLYVQMLPSREHKKSFNGVITMLLINQGEGKQHVSKSIKALETTTSFKSSDSDNIPNGVKNLLETQKMFLNTENTEAEVKYVINNVCVFGVCLRENRLVK